MASGAKSGLYVTGAQEIEGVLETFDRVVLPAELRKGTRDAAKLVHSEYRANADYSAVSGSMRDAAVVRAMKRSRVRIGHRVIIPRDKLFKLYQARTGRLPGRRKGDSEPFFYPAVVELGDKDNEAKRPLRKALYDNARAVVIEFSNAILRAINHPKIKRKQK